MTVEINLPSFLLPAFLYHYYDGINTYGHPSQETLNRLKEKGIEILRNDLSGAIGLDFSKKGIEVNIMIKDWKSKQLPIYFMYDSKEHAYMTFTKDIGKEVFPSVLLLID